MEFNIDYWNMDLNNCSYMNERREDPFLPQNQLITQPNVFQNMVHYNNAVPILEHVTIQENVYDVNNHSERFVLQEIGNKDEGLSRLDQNFAMHFNNNVLGNSVINQPLIASNSSSQVLDLSKKDNLEINVNEDQDNLRSQHSVTEETHDIDSEENIQMSTNNSFSGNSNLNINLKNSKISRKRQNQTDKAEQESLKIKQQCEKHPVLETCKNCRLKCNEYVSSTSREKFNNVFWNLGTFERRLFITNRVTMMEVKRRYENANRQRQNHYRYEIEDDKGNKRQVCKAFFTSMLGFKEGNDKMIKNAVRSVDPITLIPSAVENRGKQKSSSAIEVKTLIQSHIESYHPCVSHYRRVHAPNRRYLSSELTVTIMHKDFLEKHPDQKISYESYRSTLAGMNISFTKLGHEECEDCEKFDMHNSNHNKENLNADCNECNKWSIHNKNSKKARQKYQIHVEKAFTSSDTGYFSVDLQKVIMLPKMNEFKVALFTRRLVAFNQSFVPLGSQQNLRKPIAVIWHEAVSGRKKEDIISAFYSFFLQNRDKKHLILWLDNCSAQNKNWCLISFLVYLVNSEEIEAETIELNYFESGHTFMSADAFHHQVENSMKKKGKIYDFADFEDAVGKANSGNVIVKSMTPSDFSLWIDYSSSQKLKRKEDRPYLHDIKQVKLHRGNYKMIYNVSYEENDVLPEFDFLQTKVLKLGFPPTKVKNDFRGIPETKKNDIIQKLLPLMPPSRRFFWRSLKVSNVSDLTTTYDDDQ